jgi:glycosyltransferase involved in cell wall biosynthesis
MKALLLIQSADASRPGPEGFMADWIKSLGQRVDHLTVLTFHLPKKKYPQNIEFHQIVGNNLITRTLSLAVTIFFLSKKHKYNVYFAHIIEHFAIVAGILGFLFKIKTIFWYCQGYNLRQNFRAKLAFFCVNKIVTCSAMVRERYVEEIGAWVAKKTKVVGHGINISHYADAKTHQWPTGKKPITILYAGRANSPIKDLPTLNSAALKLTQKGYSVKLRIVSNFPYSQNYKIFSQGDIFVNPSQSRAIDKALLESLICGVIAFGTNLTYPFLKAKFPELIFEAGNSTELSKKIAYIIDHPEKRFLLVNKAKDYIIQNFSLELLMDNIVKEFTF